MHLKPWRYLLVAAALGLAGVVAVPLLASGSTETRLENASVAGPTPGPTESSPASTSTSTPTPTKAASRYLEPVTRITPVKGCNRLTAGMNGVKVKLVQRKLGFSQDKWETMDASTRAAVRRFQTRAGLPATGVVNSRT